MCGCGRKNGVQQLFNVKMPDGTIKPYSSEIAAKAKVTTTPGAYLMPPTPAG